ncbi:MAG: SHOCT domain-containing protein [Gaiellaceae bacterium]
MLGAIIAIMLAGFVTGALARLAVPGPDPMPIWLTIGIGLAGSWGGGGIAAAIWGWNSTTGVSIFGFIAAILLVIAYRRFYQGRPLTGPDAMKFPERGIGLDRFRERQAKAQQMLRQAQHAQAQAQVQDVTEQIRKLGELHDQGVLTDEEFETKKRELLGKL